MKIIYQNAGEEEEEKKNKLISPPVVCFVYVDSLYLTQNIQTRLVMCEQLLAVLMAFVVVFYGCLVNAI